MPYTGWRCGPGTIDHGSERRSSIRLGQTPGVNDAPTTQHRHPIPGGYRSRGTARRLQRPCKRAAGGCRGAGHVTHRHTRAHARRDQALDRRLSARRGGAVSRHPVPGALRHPYRLHIPAPGRRILLRARLRLCGAERARPIRFRGRIHRLYRGTGEGRRLRRHRVDRGAAVE